MILKATALCMLLLIASISCTHGRDMNRCCMVCCPHGGYEPANYSPSQNVYKSGAMDVSKNGGAIGRPHGSGGGDTGSGTPYFGGPEQNFEHQESGGGASRLDVPEPNYEHQGSDGLGGGAMNGSKIGGAIGRPHGSGGGDTGNGTPYFGDSKQNFEHQGSGGGASRLDGSEPNYEHQGSGGGASELDGSKPNYRHQGSEGLGGPQRNEGYQGSGGGASGHVAPSPGGSSKNAGGSHGSGSSYDCYLRIEHMFCELMEMMKILITKSTCCVNKGTCVNVTICGTQNGCEGSGLCKDDNHTPFCCHKKTKDPKVYYD